LVVATGSIAAVPRGRRTAPSGELTSRGIGLVAGQVDWAGERRGALYFVNQLVVGDPIEVVASNRATTRWRVSEAPLTMSKKALPVELFVKTGPPKLVSLTCGGPFDAATRHYLDNVILLATPALR
jgi:hypothetical protein